MNLTASAIRSSRLTLFAAFLILVGGALTFMGFPSQEEPTVTIRDAIVQVSYPGMPTEEVENLLAKPVEERLRGLPSMRNIVTTVQPGSATIQLTAQDDVTDLNALWQKARVLAQSAQGELPAGTIGPFVDDDFGRVAVASIAVTAPGFSMQEMQDALRKMRQSLYGLKGVDRVTFHGLQTERAFITLKPERMAEADVTADQVIAALNAQNVVSPSGAARRAELGLTVDVDGKLTSVADLKSMLVPVGNGSHKAFVPLSSLASVDSLPADPVESVAMYKGQRAVVVAISMAPGLSISTFGEALRAKLKQTELELPAGFEQHVVTFQADVVSAEMSRMHHVMGETIVIVMAVVMLFLGWRTGLIVGAIVPLTILGSLIVMRIIGVELQAVSIAAIILALGLLVDNGIVIAEDVERRLALGEDRYHAAVEAGRTLAIPLLTSSLVIVLAFSPFFFGQTSTNEYMRSLAVVLAITLLASWAFSITVTPLLCLMFAKPGHHESKGDTGVYKWYRGVIAKVLAHKSIYIAVMTGALVAAMAVLASLPYSFLPPSERLQFQVPIKLSAGTDASHTQEVVQDISKWLADTRKNPEVTESIGYVADGGPRILLGLNPPMAGPGTGYFTVSVKKVADLDVMISRTRSYIAERWPEVYAEPKRFSLGSTESGSVVYRISGSDEIALRRIAAGVKSALQDLPGTIDVTDDWQERQARMVVQVDQAAAGRLGVSSEAISKALQLHFGGAEVASIRSDGNSIPIMVRVGTGREIAESALSTTLVDRADGKGTVPVAAVAKVVVSSEPSSIVRRNLERTITVTGRNPDMTSGEVTQALESTVGKIPLPDGYQIRLGGEAEDSDEANAALMGFMPHAACMILLLFIWQFNSVRKVIIVVSAVPFVVIGAAAALLLTGYPFGFMATFGLLALGGIIVNNAVLLLECIESEMERGLDQHAAIIEASVMRLRPILMTKLTCIVGLVPLMLFAGPLWTGMAITMIGGLALATLVTLGLIPALYELLFSEKLNAKLGKLVPTVKADEQV
ncbi:efflux RND transporter permease subunit [Stenotrophomonas maltophilia]|uniref:efflux RND transporter permease subunit n=1 Tax=Stenotrophomonas maltophilia TaxID=40324 RepID=UPI002555A2CE|nr:efflux RND transporter permease subunit [Stenotrophomonas maltophilia]